MSTINASTTVQAPDYDYDRVNRAVIVSGGDGNGFVIHFVGGHLEHEIDAVGRNISDLGLDDAPEGVSIWEGWFRYHRINFRHQEHSTDPWDDYDVSANGGFRPPTDEEWEAIKTNTLPWDSAMYERGPCCGANVAYCVHGTIDGKHVSYKVCEAHKDWPATRFTPGEIRVDPSVECSFSNVFRDVLREKRGCCAERDGWKEEWDAFCQSKSETAEKA